MGGWRARRTSIWRSSKARVGRASRNISRYSDNYHDGVRVHARAGHPSHCLGLAAASEFAAKSNTVGVPARVRGLRWDHHVVDVTSMLVCCLCHSVSSVCHRVHMPLSRHRFSSVEADLRAAQLLPDTAGMVANLGSVRSLSTSIFTISSPSIVLDVVLCSCAR